MTYLLHLPEIHGSGINVSNEARTTWLIQYRDPADRLVGNRHTGSLGQGMMLAERTRPAGGSVIEQLNPSLWPGRGARPLADCSCGR